MSGRAEHEPQDGTPPDTDPAAYIGERRTVIAQLAERLRLSVLGAQLLVLLLVVILVPIGMIALNVEVTGARLQNTIARSIDDVQDTLLRAAPDMRDAAVERSSAALDERVRQEVERMTTNVARTVARFLYDRDEDILLAATLEPSAEVYRDFLTFRKTRLMEHGPWRLAADGRSWEAVPLGDPFAVPPGAAAAEPPEDEAERRLWRSRGREAVGIGHPEPLYLEMTFVGLDGREHIKVTTDHRMDATPRDVSTPEGTFARAERYFAALQDLRPGDVHVTEMVGIYRPSQVLGPYTPQAAAAAGIPFKPEEAAYAGTENPLGTRYMGLVRWATPVVQDGAIIGWVTLALDQRHLAAFTDTLDPTEKRYTDIPDPSHGNYAFMLDHKGRTITHPRHYYIVGYDPETGGLVPPWMETAMHEAWQASGLPIEDFLAQAPQFDNQSLDKKPSRQQLAAGTIAADCRYLNFAPQCAGWHALTAGGGSGSFQIFWSDVWKLNTAAPIPYFTGPYGSSERGFGYITVGVNLDLFHAPAQEMSEVIDGIAESFADHTRTTLSALVGDVRTIVADGQAGLWSLAAVLALVSLGVAFLFSHRISKRVAEVIAGIRAFQRGQRDKRISERGTDEIARIAGAFNRMAEETDGAVHALMDSEQRFRASFQQSVLLLGLLSREGNLLKANPAALKVIRTAEGAVIGQPFWDTPWWRGDAAQQDRLRQAVVAAANGYVDRFTAMHPTVDGGQVVVDLTVAPISLSSGLEILVVGHDISDRYAMERQREDLIDRLGRSNAELSRFAEVSAHHLQEPVRRLTSFSTRLLRVAGDNLDDMPEARTSLDYITENADHLRALLRDVQIYLAADQPRGDIAPVNLGWAVEEARRHLADELAAAEAEIMTMGLPDVLIDRPRLRDIVSVLLDNAIKFRRPDVPLKVVVEGALRDGAMVLRVSDNGQGIEPEFRDRVLKVFERLHRVTDYRGTGIGLAIVRRIAESMDGTVAIEDGIDGGTSVVVILRRQNLDTAPDAAALPSPEPTPA